MRKREPVKATGLIFKNGKITVIGAKSMESARQAAERIT